MQTFSRFFTILAVFFGLLAFAGAAQADEVLQRQINTYSAAEGNLLLKHPKINADQQSYYARLKLLSVYEQNDNLTAVVTRNQSGICLVVVLSPSQVKGAEALAVVKPLYEYFQNNAALNKMFDVVGAYTGNIEVEGTLIPILTAQYLSFEGNQYVPALVKAEAHSAPEEQTPEAVGDDDFCKNAMTTVDLLSCAEMELEKQDKRLNANYKKVMAKLSAEDKKALRTKQRKWIKDRDADCKPEPDSGTAGNLNSVGCLSNWTQKRADELEAMLKNLNQ